MRKLLFLFTLIFSGFVSAQTFDLSCIPEDLRPAEVEIASINQYVYQTVNTTDEEILGLLEVYYNGERYISIDFPSIAPITLTPTGLGRSYAFSLPRNEEPGTWIIRFVGVEASLDGGDTIYTPTGFTVEIEVTL